MEEVEEGSGRSVSAASVLGHGLTLHAARRHGGLDGARSQLCLFSRSGIQVLCLRVGLYDLCVRVVCICVCRW